MLTSFAMYLHSIDPYAIELWPDGPIRWYGVSYLVGFVIGWLLIRRVLQVGRSTFKPQQAVDIVVTLAIGVVVGGRLGYCLFYEPSLLWTFTKEIPFWGLFALNQGGMASHGGMIGMGIAAVWCAKRFENKPHALAHVMDLGAFGAPLGLGIGRIANFVNGELYGRVCADTLPWAVKFPQEMQRWSLYKSDGSIDPTIAANLQTLRAIVPGGNDVIPDTNIMVMNSNVIVHKIIAMIQDGNVVAQTAVAPMLQARHPSQIYQAIGEGIVLFSVLAILWAKPQKPLVIGGMFCSVYAVQRIVVEHFRLPDAQIGYEALGMTRGQWLSVVLLAAGVITTVAAATRKTPKMGGWR